jgi:hypothetical protein
MHGRNAILAAALIMAPLGAQGADLVVWWDKGFYPDEDAAVAEIIDNRSVRAEDRQPGRARTPAAG